MAEQPRKIKKYRKPLNLNIGMLIFGAIFIYVIICVILYFQTDHIVRYEVTEGSLATNNIYRGVSIRTEEVVSTDTAGYVNFYAREGERAFNRALTSKAQELLKSQYESGKWTQVQLAKAWHVSQGTVSAIVRGVKNMGAGGDGKKRTGHFRHKVSADDREQIAMRYLSGGVTQKELADEYGLDQTYVSVLVKRYLAKENP